MNSKIFSSGLIDPSKSGFLSDIDLEPDERSLISGIVVKETTPSRLDSASNALVSLYQGTSMLNSRPVFHTYTDEKGKFLFPIVHTQIPYMLKVFYSKMDDHTYKPYLSKPFFVPTGVVYKAVCCVEIENRRLLSGILTNRLHQPRRNVPVKFYLTIGQNKIPITELASARTDYSGRFDFTITSDGSYSVEISI